MTADTIGGVWTYALELCRPLTEAGIQVVLATMGAPLSNAQRAEAMRIPNLLVRESLYKLEWMRNAWDEVDHAGIWLLKLAAEFRPDVVHLNGFSHAALDWPMPKLVVAHSCVLSWWKAVKGNEAGDEWNEYRTKVKRGIRAADALVAPSHAMLESIEHYYGPLRRGQVIYNSRQTAQCYTADKQPYIFSAGRFWDEAKNISCLDYAAPLVDYPVYVAGETRRPEGGRAAAHNVKLLGQLNPAELQRWMCNAAIFALPAKYEPFGLSVLEAALTGSALVLGDIPSLREIWGDAALFVPPSDCDALAEALQTLSKNPVLCRRYAKAARTRAYDFSSDQCASAYYQLYCHLMEQRAPAPVGRYSFTNAGRSSHAAGAVAKL